MSDQRKEVAVRPKQVSTMPRLPQPAQAGHISAVEWELVVNVIWPGAKDALVICTAWNYCKARKLDPLKRPVHIVPVYSSVAKKQIETIWPGIGEIETTASRSGWAGMDEPKWGPMVERTFEGTVRDYDAPGDRAQKPHKITLRYPEWCSVTVYRQVGNTRASFTEPVFWEEAYGRAAFRSELPNDMWAKRPRGQLHKVAKAASLRAAFPEECSGDYTAEEMEGQEVAFSGHTIDGQAEATSPAGTEATAGVRTESRQGEPPKGAGAPGTNDDWPALLKRLDTALSKVPKDDQKRWDGVFKMPVVAWIEANVTEEHKKELTNIIKDHRIRVFGDPEDQQAPPLEEEIPL